MIEVERVDYVSLPSRNIQRSRRFYLETLGLPLETERVTIEARRPLHIGNRDGDEVRPLDDQPTEPSI